MSFPRPILIVKIRPSILLAAHLFAKEWTLLCFIIWALLWFINPSSLKYIAFILAVFLNYIPFIFSAFCWFRHFQISSRRKARFHVEHAMSQCLEITCLIMLKTYQENEAANETTKCTYHPFLTNFWAGFHVDWFLVWGVVSKNRKHV